MLRQIRNVLSIATGLLLTGDVAQAQGTVDIGLFQTGEELEVRLRPTEDFTGLVSAVVFTLRWEQSSGAKLGTHMQKSAAGTYIPIAPSGELHQDGSYNYQIYAGFGFDAVNTTGETWEAGKEYTIATIPVKGNGSFSLVNDSWTDQDYNNGNYYVSLDGRDVTGIIYKGLATGEGEASVAISPNPSFGIFTISIPLKEGAAMSFEVLGSNGQVVYKETPNQTKGQFRKEMDLTEVGAGNYHLRVMYNGELSGTYKILIQ